MLYLKKTLTSVAIAGLISAAFAGAAPGLKEKPLFEGTYNLTGEGKGTVEQIYDVKGDQYIVTSQTNAHMFFFKDNVLQVSKGTIAKGELRPQSYTASDSLSHQHTTVKFDDKNKMISVVHKGDVFHAPLVENVQDPASYPIQLAETLKAHPDQKSFNVKIMLLTKKDEPVVKEVQFTKVAMSTLKTPAGDFKTISLKGSYELEGHQLTSQYWYAPKLNYMMVKSEASSDNKVVATAELKSYNV